MKIYLTRGKVVFALLICVGAALYAKAELEPSVVVEAMAVETQMHYRIQGKETPLGHLLDSLGDEIEVYGPEVPCFILVHSSAPTSTLLNLKGIAEKVGYLNIRLFIVGSDKRMAVEVNLSPRAVPNMGSL